MAIDCKCSRITLSIDKWGRKPLVDETGDNSYELLQKAFPNLLISGPFTLLRMNDSKELLLKWVTSVSIYCIRDLNWALKNYLLIQLKIFSLNVTMNDILYKENTFLRQNSRVILYVWESPINSLVEISWIFVTVYLICWNILGKSVFTKMWKERK